MCCYTKGTLKPSFQVMVLPTTKETHTLSDDTSSRVRSTAEQVRHPSLSCEASVPLIIGWLLLSRPFRAVPVLVLRSNMSMNCSFLTINRHKRRRPRSSAIEAFVWMRTSVRHQAYLARSRLLDHDQLEDLDDFSVFM